MQRSNFIPKSANLTPGLTRIFGSLRSALLILAVSLFGDSLAAIHFVNPPPSPDQEGELVQTFNQAQNGDEIVLLPGRHLIQPAYPSGHSNAPLKWITKTNITVRGEGEGAEIVGDGPGEFITISECSGLRFDNITFRSNRAPVENGNWLYSMIQLYDRNEKLTFENCRFLDFGNHAISQLYGVKESTDVVVRNCTFADGGDLKVADGAAVSGIGSRWLIESNLVERCLYGFEIEGPWGTNQNITIRKNTILNPSGCGVVIFATSGKSADFSDIEISDNIIKDALRIPSRPGVFPLGILLGGGERIQVLRNTIDQCESGIAVHARWADLRDIVIANNSITNASFGGISVDRFTLFTTTNIVLRGNTISTAGSPGISVTGTNIYIHANTVENTGWLGAYGAIEVTGTSDQVRIEGNILRNRGTTFQDYGIYVRSGVPNTVIGPNTFREYTSQAILDLGTNTVIETAITSATLPTSSGSILSVFAPPRSRGHLQSSLNLVQWTNHLSFVTDANGEVEISLPAEAANAAVRFYRVSQ